MVGTGVIFPAPVIPIQALHFLDGLLVFCFRGYWKRRNGEKIVRRPPCVRETPSKGRNFDDESTALFQDERTGLRKSKVSAGLTHPPEKAVLHQKTHGETDGDEEWKHNKKDERKAEEGKKTRKSNIFVITEVIPAFRLRVRPSVRFDGQEETRKKPASRSLRIRRQSVLIGHRIRPDSSMTCRSGGFKDLFGRSVRDWPTMETTSKLHTENRSWRVGF